MTETAIFVCSICNEASADICVYCTKDTCANHLCVRCRRCSDCCECEVPLTASEPEVSASVPPTQPEPLPPAQPEPLPVPKPEPLPEPQPEPLPPIQPDPVPGTEPQPETPGPIAEAEPEPAAAHEPEDSQELEPEPEPTAVISAIEQATTHEELVAALPELFAPEPVQPAGPPPDFSGRPPAPDAGSIQPVGKDKEREAEKGEEREPAGDSDKQE